MRFNGTLYVAFQDLIDASTAIDKMRDYGTRADEWLRLTCDNGSVGWLRLNDIDDAPGFAYLALTEDKTD